MQDRIQIKLQGKLYTLPELMREYGEVNLQYKPLANQIQIRTADGKWIGNLKHDFGWSGDNAPS